MSMEWVQKALDMVVGANLIPQDLSPVVTLQDGRPRPFMENAPQTFASNETHEWNEQGLIAPGSGAASYQDGNAPSGDAQAPTKYNNKTCNVGKLASVTDNFTAALTRSYTLQLADGVLEREVQSALDYQKELKTREVLDECEWMHISGDQTVTTGFPGGQTDGLEKWILANGTIVNTAADGTTAGTATVPVAISEAAIKALMETIAQKYPTAMPDTCLVPPELKKSFNGFVGSGAGNPITRIISNDTVTQNLIAGSPEVTKYDTGFGVVDVRVEPNLSPAFNPLKTGQAYQNALFYNKAQVKNAVLRKLMSEQLARVGTSVQCMITTTFAQEHRLPKHAGILQYMKAA